MRISVWSSDVCSSDLKTDGSGRERPSSVFAARQHRWPREPDRFSIKRSSARQHYTARRNIGLQLKVEQSSAPAGKAGLRRASTASELHVACQRSEEHTSELQSLMRTSYDVFRFKKKIIHNIIHRSRSTNLHQI